MITTINEFKTKMNENKDSKIEPITKQFKNLTELSKFEKSLKKKMKVDDIDYNEKTKLYTVRFVEIKNKTKTNENFTKNDYGNDFDFEEFHNTDLDGAGVEMSIDNLIQEYIDIVKQTITKEKYGEHYLKLQRGAIIEIKRLWKQKIDLMMSQFKNQINENYFTTPPTFDKLKNKDGVTNYTNDKYKVVKFAYDDEGSNGFALLDINNNKIISWSLSGKSEFDTYVKLNKHKTGLYLEKTNENIKQTPRQKIEKIQKKLGVHYNVTYDKNNDKFLIKSKIYKNNTDSTEFYNDIKEDLLEIGIEIGNLEVYSNTEISISIIKNKFKTNEALRDTTEFEQNVFSFLNDLRDSGVTTMYGAVPYILDEFEIDKQQATKLLSLWMKNFNEDNDYTQIDESNNEFEKSLDILVKDLGKNFKYEKSKKEPGTYEIMDNSWSLSGGKKIEDSNVSPTVVKQTIKDLGLSNIIEYVKTAKRTKYNIQVVIVKSKTKD